MIKTILLQAIMLFQNKELIIADDLITEEVTNIISTVKYEGCS